MIQHEREDLGLAAPPPAVPRVGALTPPPARRADAALVEFPPFFSQPEGATPWSIAGQFSLPPTGVAVVVSYTVPDQRALKLRAIGFSGASGWMQFVTWTLLVNGNPQVGFNNVPATLGSLSEPELAEFFVPGTFTVGVQVALNYVSAGNNTTLNLTCELFGYQYRGVIS